jgi:hypothetical protein
MEQYVFNIGMNCSGTTSLCQALNILGIPSLHHTTPNGELLESAIHLNLQNNKLLLDSYDDAYKGFCDFSGETFYEKLYYDYPKAKFIFTIRPIDDWVKSRLKLEHDIRHAKYKKNLNDSVLSVFENKLRNRYKNNLEEIRKFFYDKQRIYLEFRICEGEGWNNLCAFLEKDVPNISFPYLNKSKYIL